jgi:hypothetical protein
MSAPLVLLILIGMTAMVWSACFIGCDVVLGLSSITDYDLYQNIVTSTPALHAPRTLRPRGTFVARPVKQLRTREREIFADSPKGYATGPPRQAWIARAAQAVQNSEAPVLARNRGHDCVSLPADLHETSASRPMNEVAAAHRGVKSSATARGGASDASVTILIAQNLLCVSGAAGLLTGLMCATAAACGRIRCRVVLRGPLLGECERRGSKCDSDCKANRFDGAHVAFLLLSRRSYNAVATAGFPLVFMQSQA